MCGLRGCLWRALILAAAMMLPIGLVAQVADATPSSVPARHATAAGQRQRPVTLAQRRDDVRRALSASDGTTRLKQERSRLTVVAARKRAHPRPLISPGKWEIIRHPSQAAASTPEVNLGDAITSGPAGPLQWSYIGGGALPAGFPSLSNYTQEAGVSVSSGQTITISDAFYNSTSQDQQVQIKWKMICAYSETTYDLNQTITAPPFSSYRTNPGAVASYTFTVPSLGDSNCQDTPPAPASTISVWPIATLISSGASTSNVGLGAYLTSVPPSQDNACPGSPDSAGSMLVQGVCADPVDTATGGFGDTFTDAALQGPGYPLSVTRSYASGVTAAGPMGPGWSLPWQASLAPQADGDVIFTAENGDQYDYASNGDGTFTAPAGALSVLAEQTDTSGNVTGYTLTAPDNHVLAFSASGQLESVQDSTGRGLTLSYSGGQVTSITDAAGHAVSLSYTGGLLTQIALPGGKTISYGYTGGLLTSVTDPAGNTTTYAYNSAGLLASIQDPDGNYTVRNTYNSSGQVTAQEDGTGKTTAFSYTTVNGLQEADVTDPGGGVTTHVYSGGILLESIDPLGNTTEYAYNQFLEPAVVTDPSGNVTTMTYDTAGNMLTQTDPLGNEQQWTYSAANEITSHTDALGNVTTYTYNTNDEPKTVTTPSGETTTYAYSAAGNLLSATDPLGNKTTYAYNSAGQLQSVTDPDGNATSYAYNAEGYPNSVTDPLGNVTTDLYDADEQLTKVTAPDGGATKYGYDNAGNLTSRTDPDGNAWTYAYDADNRLTGATDPLGASVSYTYNQKGDQVTYTDARGITTTTGYDADNRPVKVSYSDGTPTVTYGYDADGNTTTITGATGTQTMKYDAGSELTSVAGPGSGSFSYGYDADRNVTSRTYPDGTLAFYAYNPDEQISSMSSDAGTTTYAYDAAGNLKSTTMPNGVTETRSYDPAGPLTKITDKLGTSTKDSYALTLDADGRPTQAAITQDGTAQPDWYYGYDSTSRLTSACQSSAGPSTCSTASGGGETAWTYDKAGNQLTQSTGGATTGYSYNANDELTKAVTGSTTVTYGYNADGDQTTAGPDSYTYNGAGELSQATTSAGTYAYTYDAGGNLSSVSKNGTLQNTTIWDTNNPLPLAAERVNSSGTTAADYLYNPDGTLASMTTPAGTYNAVTDWLGSVTGLLDSTGSQVTSTTYTPYGTPSTTGTPTSNIGYAGSYTLPGSSGLDDMRARDYSPATGAFTGADPMLPVTGQPYAYAGDNPVSATDPSGMISCPSWVPGCGVITDIQHVASSYLSTQWHYLWNFLHTSCGGSAAVLTPYQLASQIAEAYGGTIERSTSAGYKVLIPYRSRGIMVRIMEDNGGYYRISIPGKETFTGTGSVSNLLEETHIPIGDDSLQNILEIVDLIMGG